jgi:hypothetical protein
MVPIKKRFIVVSESLTDREQMVILTDIHYWTDNEEQLRRWCMENHSQFVGMTVVFPDSCTLTSFILRWK